MESIMAIAMGGKYSSYYSYFKWLSDLLLDEPFTKWGGIAILMHLLPCHLYTASVVVGFMLLMVATPGYARLVLHLKFMV